MNIKIIYTPKYLKLFGYNYNNGYTLLELISIMAIMGIIGVLVAPQFISNQANATADGRSQIKGILQQSRGRAVATTSAVRVKPDSTNRYTKFAVEIANTRSCESITKLRESVNIGDRELKVNSVSGFAVTDKIKVGNDPTGYDILGIDSNNSVITLGQPLGTSQSTNSDVELLNNWKADGSFLVDDLTLPEKTRFTSNVPDWMICFNSRGIASVYDNSNGNQKQDLTLTVKNIKNNTKDSITILKGGAIQDN